jgi:hypothetical protein
MRLQAIGRRATFKKVGSADIKVEVQAMEGGGAFTVIDNGKSSATWPKYTPQEVKSGSARPMTLDSVWQGLREKYADYTVADEQDLVPDSVR